MTGKAGSPCVFWTTERAGHEDLELSQKELILRLIKHIPEKHFRMVRYFGFLANRVVGRQLPLVSAQCREAAWRRQR